MVTIDDNPWFAAKDALTAMGYQATHTSMIMGKLDTSEKLVATTPMAITI